MPSGMNNPRAVKWTPAMDEYIRQNFYTQTMPDMAMQLGVGCSSVRLRAINLGLRTKREQKHLSDQTHSPRGHAVDIHQINEQLDLRDRLRRRGYHITPGGEAATYTMQTVRSPSLETEAQAAGITVHSDTTTGWEPQLGQRLWICTQQAIPLAICLSQTDAEAFVEWYHHQKGERLDITPMPITQMRKV